MIVLFLILNEFVARKESDALGVDALNTNQIGAKELNSFKFPNRTPIRQIQQISYANR